MNALSSFRPAFPQPQHWKINVKNFGSPQRLSSNSSQDSAKIAKDNDLFVKEMNTLKIETSKYAKKVEPREKIKVFRMLPTPKKRTHRKHKPHHFTKTMSGVMTDTETRAFITSVSEWKPQRHISQHFEIDNNIRNSNKDLNIFANLPSTIQTHSRKSITKPQSSDTSISKIREYSKQSTGSSALLDSKK